MNPFNEVESFHLQKETYKLILSMKNYFRQRVYKLILNNLLITMVIFSYLIVCKKESNEDNKNYSFKQKYESDTDIDPIKIEYVNYVINPNGVTLYKRLGTLNLNKWYCLEEKTSKYIWKEFDRVKLLKLTESNGLEFDIKGRFLLYWHWLYKSRGCKFQADGNCFSWSLYRKICGSPKAWYLFIWVSFSWFKNNRMVRSLFLLEILKASEPTEFDENTDRYFWMNQYGSKLKQVLTK